jgi:hypothetical protein
MPESITAFHHAIAQDNGFKAHQSYSEKEAAKLLGVHFSTLGRIRSRGEIGFVRKGQRSITYFGFHLIDYLLTQTICPATKPQTDIKLATTGSDKEPVATIGTECGSISPLAKHAALASAQRILNRPSAC